MKVKTQFSEYDTEKLKPYSSKPIQHINHSGNEMIETCDLPDEPQAYPTKKTMKMIREMLDECKCEIRSDYLKKDEVQ